MFLLARFIQASDAFLFPLAVGICYFILRSRAKRHKNDPGLQRIYFRAFRFKVICVIFFTLLTEFYFKGGDTALFLQGAKDLRTAVLDDPNNFWIMLKTQKITIRSSLFDYFYYDNYAYDLTYQYMIAPANLFPCKLAFFPLMAFFGSYMCINLIFGFFALGGALRLFNFFRNYYPKLRNELAVACLFLPSVAFWSSALLKDSITFGSVGFIFYAIYNLFKGKHVAVSILILLICGFFLYIMKIYILLVLLLAVVVWQFTEVNRRIENKTLRSAFTFLAAGAGAAVGFLLVRYFTTFEAAQEYQFDNLQGNIEEQQRLYSAINQQLNGKDSHFTINTSNPAVMVFSGLTATFFRPFIFEINTPIALLSSIESNIFLFLTLFFFIKKGIKKFFGTAFSDSIILMCFVFAVIFAIAVGVSTANFGALSRYKIPCMPFYLVMLILIYHKAGLAYPPWFQKVVDFTIPPNPSRRL